MRFVTNPALVAELETEPDLHAMLWEEAEKVKVMVEAIAPVGNSDPGARGAGYYKRHVVVVEDKGQVCVGDTDFAAHFVEWGSVNNPPYAPIRRGVRAAGLDLRESPKP
jgi:hypothetical protein